MMKNLSISKVQISIGNLYFIFLLITALFTRSFMGLRIFGFRLGELLVAFGLFSCILYVLSQVYNKKLSNKFFIIFSLFLIYFLIVIFLTNGSLVSLYTYKSSSFIWMIGYYFLTTIYFQKIKFSIFHIISAGSIPLIIYIFNSGNYPDFIINFFKANSDKFQFNKGSDVLIAFVFICVLFGNGLIKKEYFMIYFNLIGFLLLPLFLTLSRASFFSCILYILLLNLNEYKFIISKGKYSFYILLASILLFIISSIRLAGLPELESRSEEPIIFIQESITEVVERKNTNKFLSFYFCENRLCSEDNTLDWRLDIWSDLIVDQINKEQLLIGFGFNEIFEIMKDPTAPGRLGREGLNEHVHNHIFTIVGRMGLIGVFLYSLLQFNLFAMNSTKKILLFIFPLFLVTMFDTTMESVQFPILYYTILGFRTKVF